MIVGLGDLVYFMKIDKRKDVTYRAYDLLDGASEKTLKAALAYLGYKSTQNYEIMFSVLKADLANRGLYPSRTQLRETLQEWYVWQRIINTELKRWPLRKEVEDERTD